MIIDKIKYLIINFKYIRISLVINIKIVLIRIISVSQNYTNIKAKQ